jgi:hypothetical protein
MVDGMARTARWARVRNVISYMTYLRKTTQQYRSMVLAFKRRLQLL